ncbi:MAG: prolyl oligopeptidase family serine peptidase [Myxococcota bacterium]|nr:prolyl oligopeptidase family serine peptidase [Myxococcota bacterium]
MNRILISSIILSLLIACNEGEDSQTMAPMEQDATASDSGLLIDLDLPEADSEQNDGESTPDSAVDGSIPNEPEQPEATNGLEPVNVSTWMRGLPPSDSDPLFDKYEMGEVNYPVANNVGDEDGVRWFAQESDEDGTLSRFGITRGYAVAQIETQPFERLVIRADRVSQIWTPLSVQPGDFYGSGRALAPLLHRGNKLTVAILADPRRGLPRLRLYKTTDEITFNVDDITRPDLLAGDMEALPIGVPILNLLPKTLTNVQARVIENNWVSDTTITLPGLVPGSVSHLAFEIAPKSEWPEPGTEIELTLEVHADELVNRYQRTITLTTIDPNETHRRSFISPVDGSVQYYGVRPPSSVNPERTYAAVLSLHGASVEAIGQARAYSAKQWAYIIAPTNRRPFGFDWEEWGRLNALASLDDAMNRYDINPSKVYLTGHSMGGHGTWHVGVTTPGRFATLGPSAGWESFYSYGGSRRPNGPVARSRAHSDTLNYLSNIAQRGVYIIHGDADDNVPISEGRTMYQAAMMHTPDIEMHEQPGAGHWWDGEAAAGADCVDWPPLFQFMKRRQLDPWESNFVFRSPSASYSGKHSFIELLSSVSPDADLEVQASSVGPLLEITTQNVRSMRFDRAGLREAGIEEINVDGVALELTDDDLIWGPENGKRPGQHGPFNEAFRRPFCYVYEGDGGQDARTAGFYSTYWALIGNGQSCGVEVSRMTEDNLSGRNLIRLGDTALEIAQEIFQWDEDGIIFDGRQQPNSALVFVYPEGDGLSAGLVAAEPVKHYLRQVVPFSSRSGLPDYLIFGANGASLIGHFDSEWNFEPSYARP